MIDHPRRVVAVVAIVTAILVVAGVSAASDEQASFDPSGPEFETADLVTRTFSASTTELPFVVEDEGGDALDAATLAEWHRNSDALRSSDALAGALSTYRDEDLGRTVAGTYSIADAVDDELHADGSGGLAEASDGQVKVALAGVLADGRPTATLRDQLSVHATVGTETIGGRPVEVWRSPAFLAAVRVDHSAFPVDLEAQSDPSTRTDAQQQAIDASRALAIERYARDAQDVLRGEQAEYRAWGVAIDETLTDDESFTAALPYLIGAFALIVLLVGVFLRSYWAAALAGAGLALTMLWARMIAAIAGFDESIIVDVIVPIATISFGIDFMIHAVGRCREQLAEGRRHRAAFVVGIATVGGAIGLALATSSIAFGANASSGIPGVVQFGLAAAIGLVCAFVALGVLVPLLLLRIEEALSAPQPPRRRSSIALRTLPTAIAASLTIIAIIGAPFVGALVLLAYCLLLIALPFRLSRRRGGGAGATAATPAPNVAGGSLPRAGALVAGIVRMRGVTLAALAVITVLAAIGATQVDSRTEPNDFYPADSDLVTGVDAALEHTTSLGEEGLLLYVEGDDLADPRSLRALDASVETTVDTGGDVFARNPDGGFARPDSAIEVARAVTGSPVARRAVETTTGVAPTDADGDGLPDTREQVEAVFTHASAQGVGVGGAAPLYTADQVGLLLAARGGGWATVMRYPLQGLADAGRVAAARDAVEAGQADLEREAAANGLAVTSSVSGASLTTQLRIDAITDSMTISVPLAMLLCLVVAGLVMRSVWLALASVVPIALVIAWLLGFMWLFGYSLNVVTATIAAISVGVGIDYAIHYTMRFREEWRRQEDRMQAVRAAAEGTGGALILSAATSILGFALLALAPMPVLAAYGLLTAVMIALSLVASLTVLPCLLYIFTPRRERGAIGLRAVARGD